MRYSPEERRGGVLTWLISAVCAVFILQTLLNLLVSQWAPTAGALEYWFGLSGQALASGRVWTLVTYGFLHGNILSAIGSLLGLYFIGREIIALLGTRRFLLFYGASLAAGGGLWAAFHGHDGSLLIGAMPAINALFILFACFYPDREITLLIFFVLPVTLKPKYVAAGIVAAAVLGFACLEVLGRPVMGGAAPSAYLGGIAVAWIYHRLLHEARWSRPSIELPAWMRRRRPAALATPPVRVNVGPRPNLRAEVDRILDKINSQGFGSLSAEEKRLLDEARDMMTRR